MHGWRSVYPVHLWFCCQCPLANSRPCVLILNVFKPEGWCRVLTVHFSCQVFWARQPQGGHELPPGGQDTLLSRWFPCCPAERERSLHHLQTNSENLVPRSVSSVSCTFFFLFFLLVWSRSPCWILNHLGFDSGVYFKKRVGRARGGGLHDWTKVSLVFEVPAKWQCLCNVYSAWPEAPSSFCAVF